MDPITSCVHRNLFDSVAIGSDLRFAGSTLNFYIFCLRFGPAIIYRIPHSGVGRTTHKLMPWDNRPYRPLLIDNMIADTNTLIVQVVFQHSQGRFIENFELRLRYCPPPTVPIVYCVGVNNRKNEMKLSFRPPFFVPNLHRTSSIMPPIIHIVHPMLNVIVMGEIIGILERHPLPNFFR